MNKRQLTQFRNPKSEHRGAPFWSWNGRLEIPELRRQIRIMHDMGLGGFFMHSRVGLDTAYLSKEWFACVRACVDEAEELGMRAWIYDEDRWSSGAAGGLVTRNPRYRMRRLRLTQTASTGDLVWERATLAAFVARIDGFSAFDVRRISRGYRPLRLRTGEQILLFSAHTESLDNWYNGYTYLDTMNPAAVKEFIRVTHEAYRGHEGKRFGSVIPGVFTDEPNHGGKLRDWDGGQLPWTPDLPNIFKQRYGYDLTGHLPELFFDVEGNGITPARYHYHDCTTHLFVDAFARQIGEWCEENNLLSTGHVLSEESLSGQSSVVGDCMRFYEHMQAPGMDLLTEFSREFDTAKQVSSVARQFGRRWRITETYGCTGWDFSFKGHKALSDWQLALGINLRCPHLSWYTMLGEAKRDYPASIFHQSPWWSVYSVVEDYYARLHAVMTEGKEVRDLLVVHPVESMWLLFKKDWQRDTKKDAMEYAHVALRDSLLGANIDFDYGSEDIMSRHSRVLRTRGPALLAVGKAQYKAIVIPPMLTIRPSTLEILRRFRAAGGLVVFAGELAGYVDALPSSEVRDFSRECVRTQPRGTSLVKAVESACRRVSITDEKGAEINPVLHLLREDNDCYRLFICNTGQVFRPFGPHQISQLPVERRTAAFPRVYVRGFTDCRGAPVELDPHTGETFRADYARTGEELVITTDLPRLGSRLFIIPKKRESTVSPARKNLRTVRTEALGGEWNVSTTEPNVLVLDRPSYAIGSGKWKAPREILSIDRDVRKTLGIERRGGSMVQPWARPKVKNPRRIRVRLRYEFLQKGVVESGLRFALEQPKTFEIRVNGTRVDAATANGWWVDASLMTIALPPGILRSGRNEILLSCDYTEDHSGLEIAYLLGDFGARVKGTEVSIMEKPAKLKSGDWVKQGFPFYSGALGYGMTISPAVKRGERLFVSIPQFRGTAVRVIINGTVAGIIAWEPQEVDITDYIAAGRCELRLEVISHRRNSHGPLHLKDSHPRWVGPGQFNTDESESIEGYNLVACGLFAAPVLAWKRMD